MSASTVSLMFVDATAAAARARLRPSGATAEAAIDPTAELATGALANLLFDGVVLSQPVVVGGLAAAAALWAGFVTRPEPARRRAMQLADAPIATVSKFARTAGRGALGSDGSASPLEALPPLQQRASRGALGSDGSASRLEVTPSLQQRASRGALGSDGSASRLEVTPSLQQRASRGALGSDGSASWLEVTPSLRQRASRGALGSDGSTSGPRAKGGVKRQMRVRRLQRGAVPSPDRVTAELPAIVEVMNVAVASGLSITASLQLALSHRNADTATGRWLARLTGLTGYDPPNPSGAGRTLDEALDLFGRHGGRRARAFASAVTGSLRTGIPLTEELDRLGRELRDDLRRRTERKVRRLPVLLLFPLVFCVLPALGLVAIVPVLVAAFGA